MCKFKIEKQLIQIIVRFMKFSNNLKVFLLISLTSFYAQALVPEDSNKVFFHEGNGNGHIQEINTNYKLYKIAENDIEGYSEMLSGSEFFLYPSLREDVNVSMMLGQRQEKWALSF